MVMFHQLDKDGSGVEKEDFMKGLLSKAIQESLLWKVNEAQHDGYDGGPVHRHQAGEEEQQLGHQQAPHQVFHHCPQSFTEASQERADHERE